MELLNELYKNTVVQASGNVGSLNKINAHGVINEFVMNSLKNIYGDVDSYIEEFRATSPEDTYGNHCNEQDYSSFDFDVDFDTLDKFDKDVANLFINLDLYNRLLHQIEVKPYIIRGKDEPIIEYLPKLVASCNLYSLCKEHIKRIIISLDNIAKKKNKSTNIYEEFVNYMNSDIESIRRVKEILTTNGNCLKPESYQQSEYDGFFPVDKDEKYYLVSEELKSTFVDKLLAYKGIYFGQKTPTVMRENEEKTSDLDDLTTKEIQSLVDQIFVKTR